MPAFTPEDLSTNGLGRPAHNNAIRSFQDVIHRRPDEGSVLLIDRKAIGLPEGLPYGQRPETHEQRSPQTQGGTQSEEKDQYVQSEPENRRREWTGAYEKEKLTGGYARLSPSAGRARISMLDRLEILIRPGGQVAG